MGWHDMDGWNWVWMTTMMVLFWGVIIAAAIVLVRRTGPTSTAPRDTPEDTLRQRLAQGEIDVEEYHQRLEALHRPAKR